MNLIGRWKAGIKIGPKDWKEKLERSRAQYTEVWYRVGAESHYLDMFRFLADHAVQAGLHYWGTIEINDRSYMSNLAYPDPQVQEQTISSMKTCIDTAAKHQARYVNVHMGNRAVFELQLTPDHTNFSRSNFQIIDLEEAYATMVKNTQILHAYAKNKGVMFIVESIPSKNPNKQPGDTGSGRLTPIEAYALDSTLLEKLAKDTGVAIAHDLGHTGAEIETDSAETLWQHLLRRTKALAPYVKLIHMNTLGPPWNGTDSHNGILPEDFAMGVVPQPNQLRELLEIFRDREDVWIVNEPNDKHEENLIALEAFRISSSQLPL